METVESAVRENLVAALQACGNGRRVRRKGLGTLSHVHMMGGENPGEVGHVGERRRLVHADAGTIRADPAQVDLLLSRTRLDRSCILQLERERVKVSR